MDKNFHSRSKNFNTIAEKFYPRIKIFRGIIFFLTAHMYTHSYTLSLYYKGIQYDSVTNKLSASNMMMMMMKLQ